MVLPQPGLAICPELLSCLCGQALPGPEQTQTQSVCVYTFLTKKPGPSSCSANGELSLGVFLLS